MDIESLTRLYREKEQELESAVLRGSSWDSVRIQRKSLSELSFALQQRLQTGPRAAPSRLPDRDTRRP